MNYRLDHPDYVTLTVTVGVRATVALLSVATVGAALILMLLEIAP